MLLASGCEGHSGESAVLSLAGVRHVYLRHINVYLVRAPDPTYGLPVDEWELKLLCKLVVNAALGRPCIY